MRKDHFISPRQDEMIYFMAPVGFSTAAYMKYEEASEKEGKRFVQLLWRASLLIHVNILSTKFSLYAGLVKMPYKIYVFDFVRCARNRIFQLPVEHWYWLHLISSYKKISQFCIFF